MWNSNYERVLPRDLFNESKLLEQLGRVCLAIHECRITRLTFEDTGGKPFDIRLSETGELSVENLTFSRSLFPQQDRETVRFYTNYNSRVKNPLLFEDPTTGDTLFVFDNQGDFESRFYELFG